LRDPERQKHLGDLNVDECDNIKININIRYDAMFATGSCMSVFPSTRQRGNEIPTSVCKKLRISSLTVYTLKSVVYSGTHALRL